MNMPGRYNDLCTEARTNANAAGCLLVIVDGNLGDGLAVQALSSVVEAMPAILRAIADDIENEIGLQRNRQGN